MHACDQFKRTICAPTSPTTRHLVPGSSPPILSIPRTEHPSSPPPPQTPPCPLQSTSTCTSALRSAHTRLCSFFTATASSACCARASSTTKHSQRVCVPKSLRSTIAALGIRTACRARRALPPTCCRPGIGCMRTGHHPRMCSFWAIALARTSIWLYAGGFRVIFHDDG